jgi:hypothetical protein
MSWTLEAEPCTNLTLPNNNLGYFNQQTQRQLAGNCAKLGTAMLSLSLCAHVKHASLIQGPLRLPQNYLHPSCTYLLRHLMHVQLVAAHAAAAAAVEPPL